jgi:hypothetical protein
MGLGRVISKSIIHTDLHKSNKKLVSAKLKHFWCMDESRANTDSQDSPQHEFGGSTTFPLIIFFMPDHGASTQMSFCFMTPELES